VVLGAYVPAAAPVAAISRHHDQSGRVQHHPRSAVCSASLRGQALWLPDHGCCQWHCRHCSACHALAARSSSWLVSHHRSVQQ
jgi:hypothetical protein